MIDEATINIETRLRCENCEAKISNQVSSILKCLMKNHNIIVECNIKGRGWEECARIASIDETTVAIAAEAYQELLKKHYKMLANIDVNIGKGE